MQTSEMPIPEEYRREALYSALYNHDGVASYAGGATDGDSITVELKPGMHPDLQEPGSPSHENTREYVKRISGALGFGFSSKGRFQVELRPDVDHALAGLR